MRGVSSASVVDTLPILDACGGEVEFFTPGVVDVQIKSVGKGVPQARLERVIAGVSRGSVQTPAKKKRIRQQGNVLLYRAAGQTPLERQEWARSWLVWVGDENL